MSSEDVQWSRLDDLFHRALDCPPAEREAFLARESGGDQRLARDARALVSAHERTHRLLDAPRPDRLPEGMRIGPYALERVLGSGGMATVYLAHRADQRFDKRVAIKLLHQGLMAGLTDRHFESEQRILARLEHPNIARLLDAGVTEFLQPYLVMEWVDGITLDVWMSQAHHSRRARLDLWLDLASAVAYAHQHLVVHGDLKPTNVIVDRDGRARLVDFGIGRLLSTGAESVTGTVRFTPRYASPEQLDGRPVTTASDVYGLGVLLFELVVGEHPQGAGDVSDLTVRVASGEVRVPSSVAPDLRAVLRQALSADPSQRYATVEQFADDLRRYRSGQPVRAQADTLAYRMRRFVGRHRVAVATAAVVTASMVTLTALALRQARLATEQRVRAEEVTDYIAGFLGATPAGADWALRDRGAGLRVVELADLMAERLTQSSGVHPDTEAALRYVLGMVYTQLGQLEPALAHVSRARALYSERAARDDPRRLSAELLQAAADNMLGRFEQAEATLERTRRLWADPPASALAGLHEQLGLAQFRLGKIDAAERTYTEGMARLQARLGPRHYNLALLGSNLAMVHMERGHYERAAAELEQATAIVRDTARGSSLGLAWGLVNLSNAYRFLGRHADMRRVAEEAADRMREALGAGHFALVHPLSFIAYGLAIAGDPSAEAMAREAVSVQATLAPDHYERAVGLTFLGFALGRAGKLTEADRVLTEALALRRARFEAPNWRIAETAGFLGEVAARRGDSQRARTLLDESVAAFTTLYGTDNPRTRDAVNRRDRALALTGSAR